MRWTWIAAAGLGALVVGLPAEAARQGQATARTIRVVSVTTDYALLVDTKPKGRPSKGDVIRATSVLRNDVAQFGKAKGAKVGRDVSTYTVVSTTQGDVRATTTLPGGTILVAGRVRDGKTQSIPIVGGTGAYAGAQGSVWVRNLSADGARALNVYRLR